MRELFGTIVVLTFSFQAVLSLADVDNRFPKDASIVDVKRDCGALGDGKDRKSVV